MADPNYASVVLLAVNNNGANGSTTFADQSPVARTLTASGNAAYSSTTAPTGMTTSMACDGVGDYISSTNSTDFDFGSGDFTVEAMIYFTTQPTALIVCKDDVTNRSWHLAWVSGIGWQFAYFVGGSGTNYRPGTGSVTTGTWYHVAACRSGANLRVFVNGSQVGVTHNIGTNTIDTKTAVQSVGASGAGTFGMNGWISNVRITKGVARYTANFTPPSLPLPTSAVDAPVADFTGTPTSGTTPLSVTFTDSSTNTPTSWLWERTSDGSSWTSFSTSQNPTQAFTTGTWGVRLTATNAGGSNTKTRLAYITVSAPVVVTDTGGGGNGRKRKYLGKPKVIRRSEFASREDYEQAMRAALVSIPLSEVEIPDVIEAEDDDALLAVMLRVLH